MEAGAAGARPGPAEPAAPAAVRTVEVTIDGRPHAYTVEGEARAGADRCLLDGDDDLTRGCAWAALGYAVRPFLDAGARRRLRAGAAALVRRRVEQVTGRALPGFRLERYHELVSDAEHLACVDGHALCPDTAELPLEAGAVEAWVSRALSVPVDTLHPGLARRAFCVRVVRPGAPDWNPPHRDPWIERLRHGVNLYVPLAGSGRRSSLALVPGSHRWSEADTARTTGGARIGERRFSVPAVAWSRRPLAMVRPNPGPAEALLFSGYLIHGGAVNLNPDRTRVSLEMRFWRRGGA